MNWRHGVVGAAVAAAGIGLYAYITSYPEGERKETKELLEEGAKYQAELPEGEKAIPYTAPPSRRGKSQEKTKKQSKEYILKENDSENQLYYPSIPKYPALEEMASEENEERPEYDLPPEERDFKFGYQAEEYFNKALGAKNYKVAETYIDDILTFSDDPDEKKRHLLCSMVINYLNYSISVSKNCETQDPFSVLRKYFSIDAILTKYRDDINCQAAVLETDGEINPDNPEEVRKYFENGGKSHVETHDADQIKTRGKEALEKVIGCHE